MSRINIVFQELNTRGEKALIAYLTGGFPSARKTRETILDMVAGGADIIEIGIPFSDPVADGPVIQLASQQALESGIGIRDLLTVVQELREETSVPIAFMTYYNPILQFGLKDFCRQSVNAGVDGFIVPDLPAEENTPLQDLADQYGLDLIPLVAPTSPPERIKAICSRGSGFVYCISVTGVTGGNAAINTDLYTLGSTVKSCTSLPVAIGFGVSDPAAARQVAPHADAVVVGSALVRLMIDNRYEEIQDFVRELKRAIN